MTVVDAHIHQWDPLTTPREFSGLAKLFRYVPVPMDLAKRLAPRRDREFAGDPTPFVHPYLPRDYREDAGEVPVEAIVHIEVEWNGKGPLAPANETQWVASLPFGVDTPALGAIIGAGDPTKPEFAELLEAHRAASPRFRGIRTRVENHPDEGVRSTCKDPDKLGSKAFLDGFGALADRRLGFEAWVYSGQLPQVTALAERYPDTTIVLNHLGTPAGIFGPVGRNTGQNPGQRRELFVRWRDDLAALAAHANVVSKVSGLMMPVLGHPVPKRGEPTPVPALLERISPLLAHALDVFGSDRLIWGSNFPVDKSITSLPNAAEAVATALAEHGADDKAIEQVFRSNAERVYGIDEL
ncbi:amidohydrolase family protein [Nocardia sp. CDC160]|uniref:amidohydrolase family protein n=1 Tax=Nocardia sp. CDC160 TaxID=3112166 RepID=UPI002DBAD929|nr:amidohydrolase family protein [Nocardia sp. CDC160]MEC3913021.1 amidohydrolase family protein [Nocardia sp. CDC160]